MGETQVLAWNLQLQEAALCTLIFDCGKKETGLLEEIWEKIRYRVERGIQQLILNELQKHELAPRYCDHCGSRIRFE